MDALPDQTDGRDRERHDRCDEEEEEREREKGREGEKERELEASQVDQRMKPKGQYILNKYHFMYRIWKCKGGREREGGVGDRESGRERDVVRERNSAGERWKRNKVR